MTNERSDVDEQPFLAFSFYIYVPYEAQNSNANNLMAAMDMCGIIQFEQTSTDV